MKLLAALALALLPVLAAHADDGAERARIQAQRQAAEARFDEARKACRAKFAVTDCVKAATRTHNSEVGELKRQEHVLNVQDRKRRAAELQKERDERDSPDRRQAAAERRALAVEQQKDREAVAAEKSARRSADEAARAQKPPRVKLPNGAPQPQGQARAARAANGHALSPAEEASNRAARAQRLQEAEEHRQRVQARIAQRKKSAADLPLPAASAAK